MRKSLLVIFILILSLFLTKVAFLNELSKKQRCEFITTCHLLPKGTVYYQVWPNGQLKKNYECLIVPYGNLHLKVYSGRGFHFKEKDLYLHFSAKYILNIQGYFDAPHKVSGEMNFTSMTEDAGGVVNCYPAPSLSLSANQ
jgi:hypothetical protein